jgi:hypothetical protein
MWHRTLPPLKNIVNMKKTDCSSIKGTTVSLSQALDDG